VNQNANDNDCEADEKSVPEKPFCLGFKSQAEADQFKSDARAGFDTVVQFACDVAAFVE
jgi:hypothetical protein